MKTAIRTAITAVLLIIVFVGAFALRHSPGGGALFSAFSIPAPMWNVYEDTKLRYFTPPEVHSGTIAAIDPSNREFVLMTTPTCGLPITIDRSAEPPFRDQTYKVVIK